MATKLSQKDFINKVINIHNGKYEYSNTQYINIRSKIKIICLNHGEFELAARYHLRGFGCPTCLENIIEKQRKVRKDNFIKKANLTQNFKYDYSNIAFTSIRNDIDIICPIHGIFTKRAHKHIAEKAGCPKCQVINSKNKTFVKFLENAKFIYGERYDYSKSIYSGQNNNLIIICPKHGEFSKTPNNHVVKMGGCKKCQKEEAKNKLTLKVSEFISKAKSIHGNKFDYSKSIYNGISKSIKIICCIHGEFSTSCERHLNYKSGCCPFCRKEKIKSKLSLFIKRAKLLYGDRYDYSKIENTYTTSNSKVEIVCNKHGSIWTSLTKFLRLKIGCKKCSFESVHNNHYKSIPKLNCKFIQQSNKIHNNFYNYDICEYKRSNIKVKINCPNHGVFEIAPLHHLNGRGCRKCWLDRQTIPFNEFLKRTKNIHFDKYDYSYVNYVNLKTKIKIVCKKHGLFTQKPIIHMNGAGCPKCRESKGERKIRLFLEKNNIKYNYQIRPILERKGISFDFELDGRRTLIEYNGEQHYLPISFSSNKGIKYRENKLKKQINHDQYKKKWAKENGYELLIVPYWHFHRIEEVLTNNLIKTSSIPFYSV